MMNGAAVRVATALARPRGAARLVPARLRGAALRATLRLLLRESRLDELLDRLAAGRSPSPSPPHPAPSPPAIAGGEGRRQGARSPPPANRSPSPPRSGGEGRGEGARGGEGALSTLHRFPATCLHRALAGYAALREAGEDARFVIGVRREDGDVLAHAWIEQAGRPLGEPVDPRERFTVAYVHPPALEPARPEEEPPMATRRPSPDVVFTRLGDGTGVLLHLGTKFYYALNRTGVVAWEAISRGGPADPDAIADALAAGFAGVDRARARADVEALLRELEAEGLFVEEP